MKRAASEVTPPVIATTTRNARAIRIGAARTSAHRRRPATRWPRPGKIALRRSTVEAAGVRRPEARDGSTGVASGEIGSAIARKDRLSLGFLRLCSGAMVWLRRGRRRVARTVV